MLPVRALTPTRRFPAVTWALIIANVLSYLWELALVGAGYGSVVVDWGLVPARLVHDPVAGLPTVLTSMFMHAPEGWWHIGGNMLFLWVFGDAVEDALGHWRFLGFYLLAGLAAALTQVAIEPSSLVPMVGASGAVAGVLAAYGSLYPRAPVVVLNPILPLWLFFGPFFRLPAWVIILWFFVLNLANGLGTLAQPATHGAAGVAFFAHIGGFLAGLMLVRLLLPSRPPAPRRADPWDGWRPPLGMGGQAPLSPRPRPWPR